MKILTRIPVLIAGLSITVLGLLCIFMPPYFSGGENSAYGRPLIRWFALGFANIQFLPTALGMMVVGLIYGFFSRLPYWYVGLASVFLAVVIHSLNVMNDIMRDSSSHNLWPFEFAIFVGFGLVMIVGAFAGRKLSGIVKRS
jgi:hypothetical protein